MTLVLSVPTDPKDASKMIDISADPSNKNITVTGKCPKNATSQVNKGKIFNVVLD